MHHSSEAGIERMNAWFSSTAIISLWQLSHAYSPLVRVFAHVAQAAGYHTHRMWDHEEMGSYTARFGSLGCSKRRGESRFIAWPCMQRRSTRMRAQEKGGWPRFECIPIGDGSSTPFGLDAPQDVEGSHRRLTDHVFRPRSFPVHRVGWVFPLERHLHFHCRHSLINDSNATDAESTCDLSWDMKC